MQKMKMPLEDYINFLKKENFGNKFENDIVILG
jgi:hypothetical protein